MRYTGLVQGVTEVTLKKKNDRGRQGLVAKYAKVKKLTEDRPVYEMMTRLIWNTFF